MKISPSSPSTTPATVDIPPPCYTKRMPERSRKKKPTDLNALAAAIVREATEDEKPEKNAAAVE